MRSILRRIRAALGQSDAPEAQGTEGLRIRRMGHGDLVAVSRIEGASFGSPWRVATYARTVNEADHHFIVAELDGELVAYAGFWVEGNRAHIAKVAVHPDCRRRGFGSVVLSRLLDEARRLGLPEAYLEVRRTNVGAQELYERFGFRFQSVKVRAYPDNGEDALVFVRDGLLDPRRSAPTEEGTST